MRLLTKIWNFLDPELDVSAAYCNQVVGSAFGVATAAAPEVRAFNECIAHNDSSSSGTMVGGESSSDGRWHRGGGGGGGGGGGTGIHYCRMVVCS